MRQWGVRLIVVAYALLAYIAFSAPIYAQGHPHVAASLAEYATPWPVTLGVVLAAVGIVLALIPIRRGERWAIWTSAAILMTLFVVRLTTDPRCLVVLDPHQHGCHTFVIAIVAGGIGLVWAGSR
jgi:hypothetical protein